MACQAKIYYQNQLAGYLTEGDGAFIYRYDEEYLNSSDPKPMLAILTDGFFNAFLCK